MWSGARLQLGRRSRMDLRTVSYLLRVFALLVFLGIGIVSVKRRTDKGNSYLNCYYPRVWHHDVAGMASAEPKLPPGPARSIARGLRVAVYLQVGSRQSFNEMLMCLENVVTASPDFNVSIVDVYMSFVKGRLPGAGAGAKFKPGEYMKRAESIVGQLSSASYPQERSAVQAQVVENIGADVGQFLAQLNTTVTQGRSYDIILKLHSKTDAGWRWPIYCELCGSPAQVRASLRRFRDDPGLGMLGPYKFTWDRSTPKEDVIEWPQPGQDPRHMIDTDPEVVDGTYATLHPASASGVDRALMTIVAGTMWWARFEDLQPKTLVDALPRLFVPGRLTFGFAHQGGSEHALERLFPTGVVQEQHRTVGAVKWATPEKRCLWESSEVNTTHLMLHRSPTRP